MVGAARLAQLAAAVASALNGAAAEANSICRADLDRDGVVTANDLAYVLSAWDTPEADIDGDGMTDSGDISVLLAAWGMTCLAGDLNYDGIVDGQDLTLFGSAWVWDGRDADVNIDGAIDRSDYQIIRGAAAQEPMQASFTPDRRPIVVHRVWNGTYSFDNPSGLASMYRGADAPEVMAQSLQSLYDEGWRRIWLILPAGCQQSSQMNGSLEEWRYQSAEWKQGMLSHVRSWILAHPDVSVGVYQGLLKRGYVMPTDQELTSALRFWVRLGVREFAFDASAKDDARDVFLRAQAYLAGYGRRSIMEAFPVSGGAPEREWLRQAPVMALTRYIDLKDADKRWAFDESQTEAIIEVGRGRHIDEEELVQRLMQGYVPVVYSSHVDNRLLALAICQEFEAQTAQRTDPTVD